MGVAVHSEGVVAIRSVVSQVVVTSGVEPADERQGKLSNEGTIWFFFCLRLLLSFGVNGGSAFISSQGHGMASCKRHPLGCFYRFQLHARLGFPWHFPIPRLINL